MPTIPLKVIRPSTVAGNLVPQEVKPLFRGTGDTDYVCGGCGAILASSMGPTQHVIVDSAVCRACGTENEFPRSLRA
jgi:DNA-directed RNA polymerase subunit RPC12/RpoP